ncbi:integral peroxisomal membrane peroxin-domain-containing protein [Scleroderma citrinum]
MATFEYVDVPAEATRLASSLQDTLSHSVRPADKILTSFPDSSSAADWHVHLSAASSPTKTALSVIPQLLLSSSIPTSAASIAPNAPSVFGITSTPKAAQTTHVFLSTRDPLSLPIMTTNFRRFVAKVGPLFWLQDRIEEVILWKKGWKRTAVWLAAYGFICRYPRLILLLPHVLLLGIMLLYHPEPGSPPVPITVSEGTFDWQANIQGIQNLMGAFSDAHDAVLPFLPLLAPSSYSHPTLLIALVSFLVLLPVIMADILPLRLFSFLTGAGAICTLHPNVRTRTLLNKRRYLHFRISPKTARAAFRRVVDNDRLSDKAWPAPMCTVELWENERWEPAEECVSKSKQKVPQGTWSKTHLRPSERVPWTRGQDGWSGVGGEISSNLTFSLSPGWAFIETEGWRADLEGVWVSVGLHSCKGWVYTTDTWSQPRSDVSPGSGWVTRRRRWLRRVYWRGS